MNGQFRQWAMGPCFFCGVETYRMGTDSVHPQKYTRDHLVPKTLRGKVHNCDVPPEKCHEMTVTCCLRCNHGKGCVSPESFLRKHGIPTREKIRVIHRAFNLYRKPLVEAAKSLAAELQ